MLKLTWQIKRKVDTRQHNRHQNVPAQQTRHKRKRARRFLTLRRGTRVPGRRVEKGSSKEAERGHEREEDEEEDEVCADGTDEVDEA